MTWDPVFTIIAVLVALLLMPFVFAFYARCGIWLKHHCRSNPFAPVIIWYLKAVTRALEWTGKDIP